LPSSQFGNQGSCRSTWTHWGRRSSRPARPGRPRRTGRIRRRGGTSRCVAGGRIEREPFRDGVGLAAVRVGGEHDAPRGVVEDLNIDLPLVVRRPVEEEARGGSRGARQPHPRYLEPRVPVSDVHVCGVEVAASQVVLRRSPARLVEGTEVVEKTGPGRAGSAGEQEHLSHLDRTQNQNAPHEKPPLKSNRRGPGHPHLL
jgi:hypothetical protein